MANKKGEKLKAVGSILLATVSYVMLIKKGTRQAENLADVVMESLEKIKG